MTGTASVIPQAGDRCVALADRPGYSRQTRTGTWVLVATILGSSMASIDGTVVNVALPTIQRTFQATSSDLLWIIEAYSLFLSALILVGGSLGDRLGRRRIFAAGIVLFSLASVACGFAPTIGVLIGARAVQGIGGALLVPGSLSIISAAFDEQSRGKAIGTWSGFSAISTAIGPVFGGWLVQNVSWRWVFFINVPLALVTLAVLYRYVQESRDDSIKGGIDWLGAGLVTLGLAGIVFGLIEADTLGLGDPVVLAAIVAGIVALALFVRVEAEAAAPMVPLTVFRSRTFTGTNLLTLLLYGALGGSLYFVPFDLQQVWGYSATAAGAALLPFTVIVFALSRWSGGLITRFGARLPLIVGPIVTACGFALFALPGTHGSYWTTFFPAVVVMSVGMSLVIAPLTTAVMSALDARQSGVASGVNNAVSRAAGLLAIAVFGLVVANVFNSQLSSRLTSLHTSGAVRSQVEAQKSKLAGATLPPGLPAAQQRGLRRALNESFVAGFRTAMLVGAVLALMSAAIAAAILPGRSRARAPASTKPATAPGSSH